MLVELQDATICQDDKTILDKVSFHVDQNDFIYLIGKVGSGKSTLLKALYGEVPVADGQAEILGFDLRRLKMRQVPALRRRLGLVFQDFQLLHGMSVRENLNFLLRATGCKKAERPARIEEVLDLVGLADKADRFPHELSGGEQQRVCIARALLNRPELILADEPIGNLDPDTARGIMNILRTIRDQGTAIVMVTHNLNLLSEFPGIVYRCEDGKLQEVTEEYNQAVELSI